MPQSQSFWTQRRHPRDQPRSSNRLQRHQQSWQSRDSILPRAHTLDTLSTSTKTHYAGTEAKGFFQGSSGLCNYTLPNTRFKWRGLFYISVPRVFVFFSPLLYTSARRVFFFFFTMRTFHPDCGFINTPQISSSSWKRKQSKTREISLRLQPEAAWVAEPLPVPRPCSRNFWNGNGL